MNQKIMIAAGAAFGVLAVSLKRQRHMQMRGRTVFVTGGSRGLGLLLAREFGARGANVAISARDPAELARASDQLHGHVLAIEADMTMREEVEIAIEKIHRTFGPVDVLVNNAGTMTVGPSETMTTDDYRNSIETHFWGPYFASMSVLPSMQKRKSGRIVNISSIGGKISVPHLLPYSVGKFALTGFSEGLRAELLKDNIYVTTVCPGLMRTGSPRNASFKSRNQAEYAWFSISAATPLVSIDAHRAVRRIVNACERGDAEITLSLLAKLAAKVHGLFPGSTSDLLGIVNRVLPGPGGIGEEARSGAASESRVSPSWMTSLNEQAARRNNQIA